MSEALKRNSPLYRVREPAVAGIEERPFEGQLILRGEATDPAFTGAVQSVAGMALPLVPNTLATGTAGRIAWLGPSEWLFTLAPGSEGAMQAALEAALAGQHVAVVDVTEGHTVIVLEGPDAAEILARDCPLDFHPRAFPVGSCAQSVLGKAGALFVRETEDRFVLCVRRSFAEYLWALLRHAADIARRAVG